MSRMVHNHYPVERLPDDLRQPLGLVRTVTVVIESDDLPSDEAERKSAAVAELLDLRKTLQSSPADAVTRVRALRDEWDR